MVRRTVLGASYALLQARERLGTRRPALLKASAGQPLHTSVVRLPQPQAAAIIDRVRGLPGAASQYIYPATDVHLTVLNLDRFAGGALRERIEDLKRVLGETTPFSVDLRGLGMSTQSIYLRAYDDSGALRDLRKRLVSITGVQPPLALRYLGFVNVVRFVSPELRQLRHDVRVLHGEPFGTVRVTAIEIVRTDKVLSRSGTVLLGSVKLVGR